ncbi:ROK family member transcriptional repressor [Arcticibacter svalbardensis MN12-7]|uniref:ROK family member transcriptional repressor n=2 Tax=Arcticibacter TaxID=1288026 RepID=R9GSY2_9SPHI|nr:ROK family member transcriptional repressor [Arcticibacter svalbardensis MN12-7]
MGVDIGGSHITAALVDLETKQILPKTWLRKHVDAHAEANAIIESWAELIINVFSHLKSGDKKIGIGIPGPLNYDTGVSFIKNQDKYDNLYGLNLKDLLSNKIEIPADHIRLMNDAASFLQGETFGGAGAHYDSAIGLTLGTGLGSSWYKKGVAHDADRWNHSFKDSIAEDYLSTRWFVQRYFQLSGKKVTDVKTLVSTAQSNPYIEQLFEEFGTNLAAFLNMFIAIENPEAVILGGNIAQSFFLFEDALRVGLQPQYRTIPILKAKLGEEAVLVGASSLWRENILT